jgi:hypothetical protein
VGLMDRLSRLAQRHQPQPGSVQPERCTRQALSGWNTRLFQGIGPFMPLQRGGAWVFPVVLG